MKRENSDKKIEAENGLLIPLNLFEFITIYYSKN